MPPPQLLLPRRSSSQRVLQCLDQMADELDELEPSPVVRVITSSWGMSIRHDRSMRQNFRLSLQKQRQLQDTKQKTLKRQLNPPASDEALEKNLLFILKKFVPGDPGRITPGLGLLPPRHLTTKGGDAEAKALDGDAEGSSSYSEDSKGTTEALRQKRLGPLHATASSIFAEDSSSDEDEVHSLSDKQSKRRLLEQSKRQQRQLREGIECLQAQVEHCLELTGKTKISDSMARRLALEKEQEHLEERGRHMLNDVPEASPNSCLLWIIPIMGLEQLLAQPNKPNTGSSGAFSQPPLQQLQPEQPSELHQLQPRGAFLKHALLQKAAAQSRGLVVGQTSGNSSNLYALDDGSKKRINLTGGVLESQAPAFCQLKRAIKKQENEARRQRQRLRNSRSKLKRPLSDAALTGGESAGNGDAQSKRIYSESTVSGDSSRRFSSRRLYMRKRRGNVAAGSHGSLMQQGRNTASWWFSLSGKVLRRFEFDLLLEDRSVAQVLSCIWTKTLAFARKNGADPFLPSTVATALGLLRDEAVKRIVAEQEALAKSSSEDRSVRARREKLALKRERRE